MTAPVSHERDESESELRSEDVRIVADWPSCQAHEMDKHTRDYELNGKSVIEFDWKSKSNQQPLTVKEEKTDNQLIRQNERPKALVAFNQNSKASKKRETKFQIWNCKTECVIKDKGQLGKKGRKWRRSRKTQHVSFEKRTFKKQMGWTKEEEEEEEKRGKGLVVMVMMLVEKKICE